MRDLWRSFIAEVVGFSAALLLRIWFATLRVTVKLDDPELHWAKPAYGRNVIYVCWHEILLMAIERMKDRQFIGLISKSKDGEFFARTAKWLGWSFVRGSSSRSGAEATLALQRTLAERVGRIGIAGDGPRGPARKIKPGAVFLAAKTNAIIVPAGACFEHAWRTKSWDRMYLPRPFSRAILRAGTGIEVPADATDEQIAELNRRLENELNRVQTEAEQYFQPAPSAGAVRQAA